MSIEGQKDLRFTHSAACLGFHYRPQLGGLQAFVADVLATIPTHPLSAWRPPRL
jgi:hypothetical protein